MPYTDKKTRAQFLWKQQTSPTTREEYQKMINYTVKKGEIEFFHKLLESAKEEYGDDIVVTLLQTTEEDGPFPLACEREGLEMVKELLSFEEIDFMKNEYKHKTGLHSAISYRNLPMLKLIVENVSPEKLREYISSDVVRKAILPSHMSKIHIIKVTIACKLARNKQFQLQIHILNSTYGKYLPVIWTSTDIARLCDSLQRKVKCNF